MRVFFVAVLLSGCASATPASPCVTLTETTGRPSLLYTTHAADVVHDVLPHSVEVLRELGEARGTFAVVHEPDSRVAMSDAALKGCAGLIWFTSGELPLTDLQKQRLLDTVAGGLGFVGIHGAADTFLTWPEYGEFIGGTFNGHPWTQEVTLLVEDDTHPSVAHLSDSVVLTDQIMQYANFQTSAVNVILRLDITSVDPTLGQDEPWGYPLSWSRDYGTGRVFYTGLGHGAVWDDPLFRDHLAGAVEWTLVN